MGLDRADVLIIGSGPNALIAAAYLARAGLSVTVLEEREVPGGGLRTDELLPGHRHDIASSVHPLLQFNPVIAADELGLIADHGLRYVAPDPVMALFVGDEEGIVSRLGVDATAEEISRYSSADARAFRTLMDEWEEVLPVIVKRLAGPPGTVPPPPPEQAAKLERMLAASAASVVNERFEDERTRSMLLLTDARHDPIHQPRTGFTPVHWAGMLSRVSWPHPVGGVDALARALVSSIERCGGRVVCGQLVDRIVVEGGRAVGVTTTSGERFDASRAVLSSAYVTQLPAMLEGLRLPPEFERLERWDPGHSAFVVHLVLDGVPVYRNVAGGPQPMTLAMFGTWEGLAAQHEDLETGRISGPGRWLAATCSSIVDPSRVPAGHCTVKLMTVAPYALDGDPANWERRRESYTADIVQTFADAVEGYARGDELASATFTPVDLERLNRNFVCGGTLGGDMGPDQAGPNRPVPGWTGYRMPVPGLYLTGAGTYPGGGVSGWPGRNAARAVLDDLGIDASELMREAGEPDTLPPRDGSGIRVAA